MKYDEGSTSRQPSARGCALCMHVWGMDEGAVQDGIFNGDVPSSESREDRSEAYGYGISKKSFTTNHSKKVNSYCHFFFPQALCTFLLFVAYYRALALSE